MSRQWGDADNVLTEAAIKDGVNRMRSMLSPGGPFMQPFMPFGGLEIHVDDRLQQTKTEEYTVEVELTFRQRWIEPLVNWQTQPFEPWVRTRTETRTRVVPANTALQVGNKVYMTSAMYFELQRAVGVVSPTAV